MFKFKLASLLLIVTCVFVESSHATGRMTCDSGDQSNWRSKTELIESITAKGWSVRKVKVDGGCYEVYGKDPKDRRVEAYFDPLTLEVLLIGRRGEILYKKE